MTYILSDSDRRKLEEALYLAESFVMIALPHYAIDRKEAVESVKPALTAALSLLAGLPKVQDWIPVSERLPEMGEAVLVYGPPDFGQRIDELSDDTEGVHWELCESNAVGDLVTHWRPLLTPPPLPASAAMKEHPQP